MSSRIDPRALVIVSFAALTVGFLAGYGLGVRGEGSDPEAPHPVGAQEYVDLGMRDLQAGDFESAESHFRSAAQLRPEDPVPRVNLALALLYQRRWRDADRELELARRRGRDLPEIHFLEGLLARDGLADTVRARAAWRRFLALVPADAPQAGIVREFLDAMEPVDGESP
ncbi:MAG TPA: tetratricopeptide repeat protein [Gemmatimonadota bacterium]|nr:tetratricopeptide repeat protein [Gemmatimonadota bacterium]